jgi:hypothetical protein
MRTDRVIATLACRIVGRGKTTHTGFKTLGGTEGEILPTCYKREIFNYTRIHTSIARNLVTVNGRLRRVKEDI